MNCSSEAFPLRKGCYQNDWHLLVSRHLENHFEWPKQARFLFLSDNPEQKLRKGKFLWREN